METLEPKRVVIWFSCGIASAAAAKLAIKDAKREGLPVEICYCASTLSTEHPDNIRFLRDCEEWFGQKINLLYSKEYRDIYEVFAKTRWLVGPAGARCTTELKKKVRQEYQRPHEDVQVFGFDATEAGRWERFRGNNPEVVWPRAPLLERGFSKSDAFEMIARANIEMPEMYKLGYRNNNCIGCVKGGRPYWAMIKRDFREQYDRMAEIERWLGVSVNRRQVGKDADGKKIYVRDYLDQMEATPDGYEKEPDIQCGIWCMIEDAR